MSFTIVLLLNPINLMILGALIIGQFAEHVNYLTAQLILNEKIAIDIYGTCTDKDSCSTLYTTQ